jgi:hypothetical protein
MPFARVLMLIFDNIFKNLTDLQEVEVHFSLFLWVNEKCDEWSHLLFFLLLLKMLSIDFLLCFNILLNTVKPLIVDTSQSSGAIFAWIKALHNGHLYITDGPKEDRKKRNITKENTNSRKRNERGWVIELVIYFGIASIIHSHLFFILALVWVDF